MVQCLREKFDEFDASKLHCQIFPVNICKRIYVPLLVIFMAHTRVHTEETVLI